MLLILFIISCCRRRSGGGCHNSYRNVKECMGYDVNPRPSVHVQRSRTSSCQPPYRDFQKEYLEKKILQLNKHASSDDIIRQKLEALKRRAKSLRSSEDHTQLLTNNSNRIVEEKRFLGNCLDRERAIEHQKNMDSIRCYNSYGTEPLRFLSPTLETRHQQMFDHCSANSISKGAVKRNPNMIVREKKISFCNAGVQPNYNQCSDYLDEYSCSPTIEGRIYSSNSSKSAEPFNEVFQGDSRIPTIQNKLFYDQTSEFSDTPKPTHLHHLEGDDHSTARYQSIDHRCIKSVLNEIDDLLNIVDDQMKNGNYINR